MFSTKKRNQSKLKNSCGCLSALFSGVVGKPRAKRTRGRGESKDADELPQAKEALLLERVEELQQENTCIRATLGTTKQQLAFAQFLLMDPKVAHTAEDEWSRKYVWNPSPRDQTPEGRVIRAMSVCETQDTRTPRSSATLRCERDSVDVQRRIRRSTEGNACAENFSSLNSGTSSVVGTRSEAGIEFAGLSSDEYPDASSKKQCTISDELTKETQDSLSLSDITVILGKSQTDQSSQQTIAETSDDGDSGRDSSIQHAEPCMLVHEAPETIGPDQDVDTDPQRSDPKTATELPQSVLSGSKDSPAIAVMPEARRKWQKLRAKLSRDITIVQWFELVRRLPSAGAENSEMPLMSQDVLVEEIVKIYHRRVMNIQQLGCKDFTCGSIFEAIEDHCLVERNKEVTLESIRSTEGPLAQILLSCRLFQRHPRVRMFASFTGMNSEYLPPAAWHFFLMVLDILRNLLDIEWSTTMREWASANSAMVHLQHVLELVGNLYNSAQPALQDVMTVRLSSMVQLSNGDPCIDLDLLLMVIMDEFISGKCPQKPLQNPKRYMDGRLSKLKRLARASSAEDPF